jgi:hypothetical protein
MIVLSDQPEARESQAGSWRKSVRSIVLLIPLTPV